MPDYEAVSSSETTVSEPRSVMRTNTNGRTTAGHCQQLLTMVEHGKQVLMLTFAAPGVLSASQKDAW
ncbi:hypothetical protein ACU4HD_44000 [Cupriavidus basilensis]